ncbi:hypothetical protein ACJX0J_016627, partial [Zea mays]
IDNNLLFFERTRWLERLVMLIIENINYTLRGILHGFLMRILHGFLRCLLHRFFSVSLATWMSARALLMNLAIYYWDIASSPSLFLMVVAILPILIYHQFSQYMTYNFIVFHNLNRLGTIPRIGVGFVSLFWIDLMALLPRVDRGVDAQIYYLIRGAIC